MAEPIADLYLPPARPAAPRGFAALAVAVAGLLMAGTVSVVAMADTTASTPESTVTGFLSDLGSGNVSGALTHVDPAEAGAITPSLNSVVDKLKSLGVLSSGADLGAVSGISATFDNVTLSTEVLRPGLDAVTITGGTATLKFDPSAVPVGDLVKGLLGQASAVTKTVPLAGKDAAQHPFAVIQSGDQWYISIGYTVAESARRAAGAAFPTATAPAAVGSASPDAVVTDLLSAASHGDAAAAIGLVSPVDGAPLYDYASLLTSHAGKLPSLSFSNVTTSDSPVDGGTLVTVTGLDATAAGKAISFANGCITLPAATAPACESSLPVDVSHVGIVVVQATASDGQTRWFLDPYRTVFDDVASVVNGLDATSLGKLGGLFDQGHAGDQTSVGGGIVNKATLVHP